MGYRQTVTPDRLQGRMNATMRSINRSMIVIGALVGGLVGDQIGYGSTLWIGALGFWPWQPRSDFRASEVLAPTMLT